MKDSMPWQYPITAASRMGRMMSEVQAGGMKKPTRRHLLYHVYASRNNNLWLDNIRHLERHVDQFNGLRLCSVSCDKNTHDFEHVADVLSHLGIEAIKFRNDPVLREVIGFLPLISYCADMTDEDAVWYGHTKGNATFDDPRGALVWRNIGYDKLLGHADECMDLLTQRACVGMHLMSWGNRLPPYPTRLRNGNWMLAGTYFWFRPHITHLEPDWRNVPLDRYGAEAWLGGLMPVGCAASVYQVWPVDSYPTPDPYDPATYPECDLRKYNARIIQD